MPTFIKKKSMGIFLWSIFFLMNGHSIGNAQKNSDFLLRKNHKFSTIKNDISIENVNESCFTSNNNKKLSIIVDQNSISKISLNFIRTKTIEEALLQAKKHDNITIYIKSGIYNLTNSIVLNESIHDIEITSCFGEKVILQGPKNSPTILIQGTNHINITNLIFNAPSQYHIFMDQTNESTLFNNTFLNGLTPILIQNSKNNVVMHNILTNSLKSGIEIRDNSNNNSITDNIIDGVAAPETQGGGIFLHGANQNRIAHNIIQNTAGFGIGVLNWDLNTNNVGNSIEYNIIKTTNQTAEDSGAIYILGRSGLDTGMVIAGNIIDGVGSSKHHNVGVYLDDSTSDVSVVQNLIRNVGSDAIQIHGGSNNNIENNIIDLDEEKSTGLLFQKAPDDTHPMGNQTENIISHNIIISKNSQANIFVWLQGGTPFIKDNYYVTFNIQNFQIQNNIFDLAPHFGTPYKNTILSNKDYILYQEDAKKIFDFKLINFTLAGPRNIFFPDKYKISVCLPIINNQKSRQHYNF